MSLDWGVERSLEPGTREKSTRSLNVFRTEEFSRKHDFVLKSGTQSESKRSSYHIYKQMN